MRKLAAIIVCLACPAMADPGAGGSGGRTDTYVSGSISAACADANVASCGANSTVEVNLGGYDSVAMVLAPSTMSGAAVTCDLALRSSAAGALSWVANACAFHDPVAETTTNTALAPTSTTLNYALVMDGGAAKARIRLRAITSGSATVTLNASPMRHENTPQWVLTPKGTQPPFAYGVQNLKDSGRTRIAITADAVTPAASETAITFVKDVAGTSTTGQTVYTVTTGKTLRLQLFYASLKQSSTTVVAARVRLREASSGCTTTSPIIATCDLATPATTAVANTGGASCSISVSDGYELPSTFTMCLTGVATSAAGTVSVTLLGFEY